ncbi:D-inositol-3-phosphate glycosyltransferase [subsurface metagenome]
MNILYYDFLSLDDHGTESAHIYEVLSNLSNLGHNVVLLNKGRLTNARDIHLPQQPSLLREIRSNLRSSPIFKFLEGEITVIWTFLREVQTFFVVLTAMMRRKVSPDVVYMRHDLFNGGYFLARLFKVPVVKEVNGILVDEMRAKNQGNSALLWAVSQIERFTLPRGSQIIVVASKLKEVLQRDYRVPENKIVVIPNGANIELFKPMDTNQARRQIVLPQSGYLVVFVGGLVAWEGVDYLIKSIPYVVKECPATRFLIVGGGMMGQELVELARQVGVLDKIIFTGRVPYPKVHLYLNAGDVCVAPFLANRNERIGISPLKICEYMACEKPVVASRVSGLEILEDNNTGILVKPESSSELAQAVVRLLQSKELRQLMGKNGRRYVVENLSWESVAGKIAEVLQTTGTGES